MAKIELRNVRHAYAAAPGGEAEYALKSVDYAFEDGGAYALLGPSGCGKTTLLNIVSGLVRPTEGRILFSGNDVTPLATEARNIAQVFQFPVVYDTMTVRDNLAFPLRNRGMDEASIAARVNETMAMLGLDGIADRRATGFTADVKQKVSLGRGLVRRDVNAILFDEPLTVIDPHMKWQLRAQLKLLHRQFGHTMIYVTHDQTEALTFADRVAVMVGGEIVQIGTPEELFERPSHTFVGHFIGSPGMNVLPVTIEGARAFLGKSPIPLARKPKFAPGARIELGVRPEYVRVGARGLPATVHKVEDIGRHKIVRLAVDGHPVAAIVGEDDAIPAAPCIEFLPAGINLYADSRRVSGDD